MDKPRLKGYEHMQKNIKTAPGCNLTFRKNCLDKWVHLIHPGQIRNWKATATKGLIDLFTDKRKSRDQDREDLIQELYRQLGQLNADLNWLKKKSGIKT